MKKTKIFVISVLALIVMLLAVGCNFGGDKKFTVTFNSNSGSPVGSQSIKDGEKAAEPSDPTREDYTFGGWYISTDFSGTAFSFDTIITGDIILNAKWIDNAEIITANIDALPVADDVTLDNKTTIVAIRVAYSALSETGKARVAAEKIAKLKACEDKITALEAAKAVADFDDAISEIPVIGDPSDVLGFEEEDIKSILDAFDYFDALTPAEKAAVTNAEKLIAAAALCDSIEVTKLIMEGFDPSGAESIEDVLNGMYDYFASVVTGFETVFEKYDAYRDIIGDVYAMGEELYEGYTENLAVIEVAVDYYPRLKDLPNEEDLYALLSGDKEDYADLKEDIYYIWLDITSNMDVSGDMPITQTYGFEYLNSIAAIEIDIYDFMGVYAVGFITMDIMELGEMEAFSQLFGSIMFLMDGDFDGFVNGGETDLGANLGAEASYQAYQALIGEAKEFFDTYLDLYIRIFLAGYENVEFYEDEDILALFDKINEFFYSSNEEREGLIENIQGLFEGLDATQKAFVEEQLIWKSYLSYKDYLIIEKTINEFWSFPYTLSFEELDDYISAFDRIFDEYQQFWASLTDEQKNWVNRSPKDFEQNYFRVVSSLVSNMMYYQIIYRWNDNENIWSDIEAVVLAIEIEPYLQYLEKGQTFDWYSAALAEAKRLQTAGVIALYDDFMAFGELVEENVTAAFGLVSRLEGLEEGDQDLLLRNETVYLIVEFVDFCENTESDANLLAIYVLIDALPNEVSLDVLLDLASKLSEIDTELNECGLWYQDLHPFMYLRLMTAQELKWELETYEGIYQFIESLEDGEVVVYDEWLFNNVSYYDNMIREHNLHAIITNFGKLETKYEGIILYLDGVLSDYITDYNEGKFSSLSDATIEYEIIEIQAQNFYENLRNMEAFERICITMTEELMPLIERELDDLGNEFGFEEMEAFLTGYGRGVLAQAIWWMLDDKSPKYSPIVSGFANRAVSLVGGIMDEALENNEAVREEIQEAIDAYYLLYNYNLFGYGDQLREELGGKCNELHDKLYSKSENSIEKE